MRIIQGFYLPVAEQKKWDKGLSLSRLRNTVDLAWAIFIHLNSLSNKQQISLKNKYSI